MCGVCVGGVEKGPNRLSQVLTRCHVEPSTDGVEDALQPLPTGKGRPPSQLRHAGGRRRGAGSA